MKPYDVFFWDEKLCGGYRISHIRMWVHTVVVFGVVFSFFYFSG